MSNSILMNSSPQNEVIHNGPTTGWDNIRLLRDIPADVVSARVMSLRQLNIGNSLQVNLSSFFTELTRRKVYKVAAAYAVASWLLIQAASIFLPTFDAPPCMMKAVVALVALGFLPSVILSWIFDITPQGIKRTADISLDETADIIRQLETQAREEFVRGYLSAVLYGKLGNNIKGLDHLQHECLNHDINAMGMSVDAMFDAMRADPRFEALLQKAQ